jgi:hypothetical protein
MPSNFPSRAPVGLITGSLSAVLCLIPILAVWHLLQTPVRKFYFSQYVLSFLSQTAVGSVAAFFRHSHSHIYQVLVQKGHLVSGVPDPRFALSVRAVQFDSPAPFYAWVRNHIYSGSDLPDLLQVPLAVWCLLGPLLFGLGVALDFRRRKRAREGQQLRGGELLSVDQFNRATKGDGFALYVKN